MNKFMILALLFSLNAFAGNEDRLRDLIKKDVASKISGGKGLNDADKKEYNRLSEEVGLIKSSQMTNEVMSGVSQSKPSGTQAQANNSFKTLPEILVSSPNFGGLPQRMNSVTKTQDSQAAKDKQKKEATPSETKNEMPPITVVINQGPNQNQMPEEPKKIDPAIAAKNEEKSSQLFPQISKETEKELMKNYKAVAEKSANETEQVVVADKKRIGTPSGEQIYTPSPIGTGINSPGFTVDRDSMAILHKPVSVNDSINIDMCIAYGAAINFDESIKTTIGRVQSTDDKYFRFQETPNKRGVYVSLIKPVPKDGIWLSSIMLYRKDNDLIYLINLRGRPCPEGVINFPKVVYLSEKKDRSARLDEKYKMADMEVLTPEDTIISVSKGFDRTNEHQVSVYDMVASAGTTVVTMGVELDALTAPEDGEFRVLDFHQVTPLKTTAHFLELQSRKASEQRSKKVQRFNLTVEINKDYMLRRRYIYLMYINNKMKNYEYIMVDTAQFMKSLKDREFEL